MIIYVRNGVCTYKIQLDHTLRSCIQIFISCYRSTYICIVLPRHTILYYIILYYIIVYYITSYYIISYSIKLYHIILYYIVIVWYCIVFIYIYIYVFEYLRIVRSAVSVNLLRVTYHVRPRTGPCKP